MCFGYDFAPRSLNHAGRPRRDRSCDLSRRAFFYLPLEHAEDAAMQARSVACFEALAAEASALSGFLDYARANASIGK